MKRELDYFLIDSSYGWNQDWFKERWMKMGGCGCVTACDSFVHMKKYKNKEKLYPYDVDVVDRGEYFDFTNIVKPLLRPRFTGIDRLDIYIDGVKQYLIYVKEDSIDVNGLEGYEPFEKAKKVLKKQIDNGFLVPMLILKHKNPKIKNYVWHWFILSGYEELNGKMMVKTVTYGKYEWLDFADMWDSGYDKKGGLIIYSEK